MRYLMFSEVENISFYVFVGAPPGPDPRRAPPGPRGGPDPRRAPLGPRAPQGPIPQMIGKNTFASKLNGVELWPFEV